MTEPTKPRLTAEGLGFCWACALMLAWGALRFDGFFLLLGVAGAASIAYSRWRVGRNLEGIVVERRQAREIFAGEPCRVEFGVRTEIPSGSRRNFRLRDSLAPRGAADLAIPILSPGDRGQAVATIRLSGRGRREGPFYELRSRHPCGFFEIVRREPYRPGKAEGLIVFPRPVLPPVLRAKLDRTLLDHALAMRGGPDAMGELRGIRDYRAGDPFRGIHWQSTARGRPLMVREWDPPQPEPLRFGLVLHSFEVPGGMLRPERFERVLRVASGLLRYCQELSLPVKLLLLTPEAKGGPVFLEMPGSAPYRRGFETLAFARRRGLREAEELAAAAGRFRDCGHLFVIGDSPMRIWKQHVPSEEIPVVFVDPESVAVAPRKLRVIGGGEQS